LSALALRLLTQDGRTALAGEAAEVKDAGEETADGRACRVLRLSYPSRGAVLALWVDREGLLARRLQLDLSASAARNYGRPIQETRVVVSEDLRDIAVDAPLTEADFAFRPMPAWRCVDELNLDGRTPLPPDAQTLVGKAAPVVALTDGAGVVIHAPSGDGRPALLLFWRESEACGLALDTVNALSRAYAARGVGFYAVHVGNGNAAAAGRITEAVRRRGSHAPVFLDARGMAAASYQVRDLPVVAVVDRQGVLRRLLYANVLGLRRELRRELDAVANPVSLTEKPQDR
jgi:hypothetical protein